MARRPHQSKIVPKITIAYNGSRSQFQLIQRRRGCNTWNPNYKYFPARLYCFAATRHDAAFALPEKTLPRVAAALIR
jgi:hypothetical protein